MDFMYYTGCIFAAFCGIVGAVEFVCYLINRIRGDE